MKILLATLLTLTTSTLLAQVQPMTLQQARDLLDQPLPANIQTVLDQTPRDYMFFNSQGESSVNYQGQVMRNVLINDNKGAFVNMSYGSLQNQKELAVDKLDSYFLYDVAKDGGSFIATKISNENGNVQTSAWEGFEYSAIFPRAINLKSKMAGEDGAEGTHKNLRYGRLVGWNTPAIDGVKVDRNGDGVLLPAEFFETLIEVTANNASGSATSFSVPNGSQPEQKMAVAALTPEGLNLGEVSQKFLQVSVAFSQAAGDYLSDDIAPAPGTDISELKGFYGDNGEALAGRTYTYLQHYWDEAFGYFGAARNFLDYTDQQISKDVSIDAYTSLEAIDNSNGNVLYIDALPGADQVYSLSAEKNLGFANYAGKRDLTVQSGQVNFTESIMQGFLQGRQLVQEKPDGYLPYAQATAVVTLHEWERLIAANAIHYLNATRDDLLAYGTSGFRFDALAGHYSEMKAYALGFQFNPRSIMPLADFEQLHQWMGDRPVDLVNGNIQQYVQDLALARDLLQKTYGFETADVETW